MDKGEYNTIRQGFGLTHAEMAHFLGVTPVSSRRWGTGAATIPNSVAILLRLMVAMKLDPPKVREWLEAPR